MRATATAPARRLGEWGAGIVGFAMGGFLDGILFHQVMQWHHYLSAIPGVSPVGQIRADGWFHLAMYLVLALGLILLWRRRTVGSPASGAGRFLG